MNHHNALLLATRTQSNRNVYGLVLGSVIFVSLLVWGFHLATA